jgi:hypothetical protein
MKRFFESMTALVAFGVTAMAGGRLTDALGAAALSFVGAVLARVVAHHAPYVIARIVARWRILAAVAVITTLAATGLVLFLKHQAEDAAVRENAQSEQTEDTSRCSAEAHEFGVKIQDAIKNKDLAALYSLVVEEPSYGPRKAFALNKPFDEIFTKQWRDSILSSSPCEKVGYRGYMIANGHIWFDQIYGSKEWTIRAINGALEEINAAQDRSVWIYGELHLHGSCFTTRWLSGDNYDHFHDTYAPDVDYEIFSRYIGRYMGKQVPIEPIPNPWDDNENEKLSLAVSLADCAASDDQEKSHEVIKTLPLDLCSTLAPNYPKSCRDIRLVKVSGPCGGSMGCDENTGAYGVIEIARKKAIYVVPLVNFDNENDALNFLDDLQ